MDIIRLENIVKKFPKGVTALNDVSINIEKGKFTAIMGPSGSGKSTLLNIIGLLDTPTSGNVYIDEKVINGLSDKESSHIRMKEIGFIFQGFYLNQHLNALDNVIVPMQINPEIDKSDYKNRALELLSMVKLEECQNRLPKELSGGEQQRVCIARALANSPNIILADEPTGNLDEENERNIFDILKGLSNEGKTVIVISHNEIVKEYADTVIQIKKGKI